MIRKGLDFFPLNTVLDDKFQLIEAEFGLKGFAIVVKLLQKIYRDEGYYCEWNDDVRLLFAQSVGQNVNLVSDIVRSCIRRGLFDGDMLEKYEVLTSAGIQKRFFGSTSRRVSVDVIKDYLLVCHTQIPQNVNILSGNVDRNQKNVDRNSIKRDRQIDRETEEDAPAAKLISFYQKNMGVPLTSLTMEKLLAWMKDVDVSLIEYAIEQATVQNKRTWAYVEAILNNHANAGRKTRAEAEDSKPKQGNKSLAKPTAFTNFNQPEYDFDAFERRSMKGGKKNDS